VAANPLTLVAFALGNILGTQTFQTTEAPGYISSKISIAATLGALCFIVLLLCWHDDHLNKKNERILTDMNEAGRD
jgi:MFS transporter, ACS family, allantoate permease